MGKVRFFLVEVPILFSVGYILAFLLYLVAIVAPLPYTSRVDEYGLGLVIRTLWTAQRPIQHYFLAAILVMWVIFYAIYLVIKKFIPWPFKKPLLRLSPFREFRATGLFGLFDATLEIVVSLDGPMTRLKRFGIALLVFLQKSMRSYGIDRIIPVNVTGKSEKELKKEREEQDKKRAKEEEREAKRYYTKKSLPRLSQIHENYMRCLEDSINSDSTGVESRCRLSAVGSVMATAE